MSLAQVEAIALTCEGSLHFNSPVGFGLNEEPKGGRLGLLSRSFVETF